jgi:hypothetical protein
VVINWHLLLCSQPHDMAAYLRAALALLAVLLAGRSGVAGQDCLTVDTRRDGGCAELLSLGFSCEDLACYARPVDLSGVGGRPVRCGVQRAAGYAGQCSWTCGQNAYDGIYGEGSCAAALRTHPTRCHTQYARGAPREGQCDFACGFCSAADSAPAPLPPPPPPRRSCATSDLMDQTTAPGSCSAHIFDGRVSCDVAAATTSAGVSPCNLACQHNVLEHPTAYVPPSNLEDLASLFAPLFPALGVPNAAGFVRLMRPGLCQTLIAAFAQQTQQDLCAGYLNDVLLPIMPLNGQGACDFACNLCHSDDRVWSTGELAECRVDSLEGGATVHADSRNECEATGGTYVITTPANLDCSRGDCCSHNPAGDTPQCPSWIAAFGEHACSDVFAPDRARAGQCDEACGFCDAPQQTAAAQSLSHSIECTLDEFGLRSATVTEVCCTSAPCPAGGIPASCSSECAAALLPFQRDCSTLLDQIGVMAMVASAAETCPAARSGH